MDNNQTGLLLSICIPTRGRQQILKKTLSSIFNSKVNISDYEVVIYDSSDYGGSEYDILREFPYANLVYKTGPNNGFLNIMNALKIGNGNFLKLHNDYCEFCEDGLQQMVDLVKNSVKTQPVLFFPNGNVKINKIEGFDSFNGFMYSISFYSSWSSALGIWKTDFERIKNIDVEPMFPHASLLFALSDKPSYLVNNNVLVKYQEVNTKGGYNLFETFAVIYLGMIKGCLQKKQITLSTFQHIKSDLLINFLSLWYCKTKILANQYTFTLSGIKSSIKIYYSNMSYFSMVLLAYGYALKMLIKTFLKLLLNKNTV
ncbi:MAG: glycosyltransferase [Mucilaginibacter sp.]|uniref:glycosyltransferase family 2 protein n=1 Tax=Mucilaginibacter sp. TaxID=1882438 RepID=UPI0032654790